MKFVNAVFMIIVFCGMTGIPGAAQEPRGDSFSVSVAKLENGTNIDFALVRSRSTPTEGAINQIVFPRSRGVNRVLYDHKGGLYFGYRLEAAALKKREYRLEFKSLQGDIASELRKQIPCSDCPPPMPLAGVTRFPDPVILKEGDICAVDLLINPRSGERIVDVIILSPNEIPTDTMRSAADRIREAMIVAERGDAHAARGNNARAIDEYARALQINPKDATTRNKLGIMYQRLGLLDMARSEFENVIRQNPKHPESLNNLGGYYHINRQFQKAISYYLKAIDVRPSFAQAYKNMGAAYFELRQFEPGYRALQAALRLDPTIFDGDSLQGTPLTTEQIAAQLFYFAKLNASNGQNEPALRFLEKAADRGYHDCTRVQQDPDLRSLTGFHRFRQAMQRICGKKQ